jgi:hypothetical protein
MIIANNRFNTAFLCVFAKRTPGSLVHVLCPPPWFLYRINLAISALAMKMSSLARSQ